MPSISSDKSLATGLGPLRAIPTITNTTTLGTTGVLVAASSETVGTGVRRVRIINGSSSNNVAYKIVAKGAAAPTITADFGANSGTIVLPNSVEFVNLLSTQDLYIVASGASTSAQVTVCDE